MKRTMWWNELWNSLVNDVYEEESINNITPADITAFVDLKNYGVGEHEVEVQVTGTDLKLSYESKTKKIKVRISEK